MKRKLIITLITTGTILTLATGFIFLMAFGAYSYTARCPHISDKQGIACEVGDTLYIDDLAYFSNCDDRKITSLTDCEGEISEDGTSVTITKADSGFATIYVYAHKDNAPEQREHGIKVMIKDA